MGMNNRLDELLRQRSKIKVLRFLFAERDECTGREIARGIDMSPSATYKTLQTMKAEGLLSARRKGNAILYSLMKGNYIIEKLLGPLFEKEESLYKDMASLIKTRLLGLKEEIVTIAIFGSIARKEDTARSDIDLLVLTKNKHSITKINDVIDELNIKIARKFSTAISPYILTEAEIKRKYQKKEALIRSIMDNNRLIYGEPIERLLA